MQGIELYGHPDSGHACKVALGLALAGIKHRVRRVDIWAAPETRPAKFLAANPAAEVPVLILGDTAYVQSGAILLEIATRFNCLGGNSKDGIRRGREILMWEANRFGMCLPQLKEARRVDGLSLPLDVISWLQARYETDSNRFGVLLGDAPFFHGSSPGIGDCAVWGYAQWLDEAGVDATPAMSGWIDRMRDLSEMKCAQDFFPDD